MEAPRLGTASPRKIFALARCTQHDKATYHLRVSSDGSSSKCAALRCASLRMSAAVSLAMKPCRSNASARKSKGCSRRPVLRSNTGWSRFFRRAHSSATLNFPSVWFEKRENVQHLHSFGSSCFQCTPGWMLVSQLVHFLVLPSGVVFAMRPFM